MSQKHGALVVFGSGPGIGSNVAKLFAERGFAKVIITSRDANRLNEEVKSIKSAAPDASVEAVPIDLADSSNVQKALAEIDQRLNGVQLECILYNAARLGPSKPLEWPAEKLEADLRISVVSLYAVAQWAIPQYLKVADDPKYNPALLVVSGFLYKDPFPQMFSLAASKAGQYNLVHSLHKEYEPKGIHCALIIVGGTVADKSEITNARNIAEETWKLHQQPKGKGHLELVLSDPDFENHKKRREQER